MIKKCLLIILLTICLFGCSNEKQEKTNIDITKSNTDIEIEDVPDIDYDAKLKYSEAMLKQEPKVISNTLKYLDKNEEILILSISQQKELIENMYFYWYQVRTTQGDEGWLYGAYLDINDTSSYYIKKDENKIKKRGSEESLNSLPNLINYSIDNLQIPNKYDIPVINSDIDSKVYNRLAGIYTDIDPSVTNILKTIELRDFSWGKDYHFGRVCYYIDYEGDSWVIAGGGEAVEFKTVDIENDIVKIERKYSDPKISDCELKNGYIIWDNKKYYKLSGPDMPMIYIKEAQLKRKAIKKQFKIISNIDSEEIIGELPFDIYEKLLNNKNTELIPYISENYGLKFKPNNYIKLYKSDIKEGNEKYNKAISSISRDLSTNPDFNESVPFYNDYMILNINEIQAEYPNSIAVELYYNKYSTLGLVFVYENNAWKLACIANHLWLM